MIYQPRMTFISNLLQSQSQSRFGLADENLFLRKELALYQEREKRLGRIDTTIAADDPI